MKLDKNLYLSIYLFIYLSIYIYCSYWLKKVSFPMTKHLCDSSPCSPNCTKFLINIACYWQNKNGWLQMYPVVAKSVAPCRSFASFSSRPWCDDSSPRTEFSAEKCSKTITVAARLLDGENLRIGSSCMSDWRQLLQRVTGVNPSLVR